MIMRPITRRTVLATSAAAASALALASCGPDSAPSEAQANLTEPDENFNAEGMPIVDEKITLTMMTPRDPNTAEDWNEVASMKEMEKISNIHVDWGLIPWEARDERRNLALASGDYPEILHRTNLGAADIAKYGDQGVFLALDDAIAEYMPNLSALLEKHPDIKKGLTLPDGKIYSLPTINDPEFESLRMQHQLWVRQDWLDGFGMDLPETLDEFEAYLLQVKNMDTGGGPSKIPYSSFNPTLFIGLMHSTFGLANRGLSAGHIDSDGADGLRFWRTADGYREELEFIHRLYSQGLIQDDIFTIDLNSFSNLGTTDIYGAVGSQAPARDFGPEVGDNYVALKPLKKTANDEIPTWNWITSPLQFIGQFVITDKAAHALAACRWMDHFYGEEGVRLFHMGIEGVSYEETEDGLKYKEEITHNPDGSRVENFQQPYVTYRGGFYPGYIMEKAFDGTESTPQAREGTAVVSPYQAEEVWPLFTYTPEEASELSSITVDLEKLITESEAKFITGEMDTETDWDNYVSQFDQMGLDRYMEIQQTAYDRYKG